jgi:hypothetical protein
MPFDNDASIELIRRTGGKPGSLQLSATVYYTKEKRNPRREGRFYTVWNSKEYAAGSGPHVFLDAKGKGHYVGSILQANGLHPGVTVFFEGDDSTSIDGRMAFHGTGSEDYFNGGWYAVPGRWDGRMSLPVHGALDYNIAAGRTGAYRFYLGDKMSFEKEIYQSIEHGPEGNNIPAHYRSLALYYSDRAPAFTETPTNMNTRWISPDTLVVYPQLLRITGWGDFSIHSQWVGEDFSIRTNDETSIEMALGDIAPGRYRLFLKYSRHKSGCAFSLWQRQTQITDWISTVSSTWEPVAGYYAGELEVDEHHSALTFHFKTNGLENTLLFNRFTLVKIK